MVRAPLCDPPGAQHQDFVGRLQPHQPVGDEQRCASRRQILQGGQHFPLGEGVQVGRRFVQNQDRRILEDGAGNGQSLALPPAQAQPLLPDPGIVALGQ